MSPARQDAPSRAVDPHTTRRRNAVAALFLFGFAALGLAWAFEPSLRSGFLRRQPDPGDSLLLNYLLEHIFRVCFDSSYSYPFWSPPFFYPQTNVLAYSETLVGVFPLYAVFRLLFSAPHAFLALMMTLLLASYAALFWVARRMGSSLPLAVFAAFVYAFGLLRIGHLAHGQLLPAFPIPLAIYATLRLLEAPTLSRTVTVLLLLYYQLLCGIYLGWFLALTIGLLLLLALSARSARQRLSRFLRSRVPALALVLAGFAALTGLFLAPYISAYRQLGTRPWEDVRASIPNLGSWLTAPEASLFSRLLWHIPPGQALFWEHILFPGFLPILLTLATVVSDRRHGSEREPRQTTIGLLLLTAASLFLLSLAVPIRASNVSFSQLSAWSLVYRFVPGAGVIRAVGRVWTVILPLLLLAAAIGVSRLLRRLIPQGFARATTATALLLIGVFEQRLSRLPSFDGRLFDDEVRRLSAALHGRCQVGYVRLSPNQNFVVIQLLGMWSGLEANVPVVNGYSGNSPPGYKQIWLRMSDEEVERWLGSVRQQVCFLDARDDLKVP